MQEMLGKLGIFHEYAVKLVPRGNKNSSQTKISKRDLLGNLLGS